MYPSDDLLIKFYRCARKEAYRNINEAQQVADIVNTKNVSFSDVTVYPCSYNDEYHIGRGDGPNNHTKLLRAAKKEWRRHPEKRGRV